MSEIWKDIGPVIIILVGIMLIFVLPMCIMHEPNIEIQDIKEVDNGYYITINNEIYYKE